MFQAADCFLVMGQRRCGKSHLTQNIQKLWPRKIVIDTLGEYSDGEIVYSFHDFADTMTRLHSMKQNNFTVNYQFDPESDSSLEEFDHILRLAYYFGNVQVTIDEIQLFSTPHSMPKWLTNCLLRGRHRNVSLIMTTQRPALLNKTIVSQCAHIFVGRTVEPNDLKYVSGFLGNQAERLIDIPERRFLYFHNGQVKEISNDF